MYKPDGQICIMGESLPGFSVLLNLHLLPGSVQTEQVLQDVFHSLREAVAGQVRRRVDLGLVSFPVFTCGGQTNSRRQRSGGVPSGS